MAAFAGALPNNVMLLLIDNYDSFVQNLARYFRRLGCETTVVRNDAFSVEQLLNWPQLQGIILSPGPCTPNEAGCSLELVRRLPNDLPLLGVCLGHQTIAQAFGAQIVRANEPQHGRASVITHTGQHLFDSIPSPCDVGRYHSLVVDPRTLPSELQSTAQTTDGTMMALAHRTRPIYGVQFHPESVLTTYGYRLLANFLTLAKIAHQSDELLQSQELPAQVVAASLPSSPVTF
jgi:anthranilate synthase component II